MIGLTYQQLKALNFIRDYSEQNGTAPSYSEIGTALDLRSRSGVVRIITGLEERGRIRRLPNKTRAIEIVRSDMGHRLSPPVQRMLAAYCATHGKSQAAVLDECVVCWLDFLAKEH